MGGRWPALTRGRRREVSMEPRSGAREIKSGEGREGKRRKSGRSKEMDC